MGTIGDAPRPEASGPARGLRRAMARWLSRRAPADPGVPASAEPRARFRVVCIAREAGAGGSLLGRMVADRLGWTVYDSQIVATIARRMERPIEEVETLDELSPSVVQDWFLPLREEHWAPLEAYLDHLAKLVLSIGHAGDAVVVGRGAGFMIPRHETLSVRVIAPLKARSRRLADRLGVSPRTARRLAVDLDRRRRKFARTMFRVDDADPHQYDLVIDTESLGLPIACELIARAVEAGRPGALPTPSRALPPPTRMD
ncbi:cytidylate kinase-like family protein [Tautonia sociabilis]|uniref:Cytidylate kinase-like family protein n=1 Tax=Tautonia sociabilis TaxID=2080755 RepID=A0A432MKA7_9BACT|nr:cytidylate kinase-like family protein [Tautonia sociabilis]RUL87831.1 cytidylate kinase-like family protein [Tautonia sociabilis]